MTITHKINMDLSRGGIMPRIPMVQGDAMTRKVEISLLCNGLPWQIPGEPRALIRYRQSDGTCGTYDTLAGGVPAWEIRGNTITITIAPEVLTVSGEVTLMVSLISGEQVLSTFEMALDVQPIHSAGTRAAGSGSYVAGMIPGPVNAREGQILAVDQISDTGTVRSFKAVDLPESSSIESIFPDPAASGEAETVYLLTMSDGAQHRFSVKNGSDGAQGMSAYEYAREGGYTGTEAEFAAKLAREMPETLPNPHKLTLTGAVSAQYDGASDITVEIPAPGSVEPETETVLSDNLLDKSLMSYGYLFYYGGSGYQMASDGTAYAYYGFIPLRGAGTYRTKFQKGQHSSTGTRIALVDDDNNWVVNATGTLAEEAEDNNWVDFEFVVTEAMIAAGATKIAFDVYSLYYDKTMIVKDREYPQEYIPYGYIEVATDSGKKQNNALCGKTAVFLGDSICAGTTVGADSEYYAYGWGGIIGEANRMNWTNYGKNGGTITHRGSDNTCIASIADTAIAEHPAADYVIFEGGCNDADQMKDAGLGEISSDYAYFDTTTFSGALESLILKLVTAYPSAKIGYVIPQKMYTGYADYTAEHHIHRRYFDRAAQICRKWGIPVVDIWNGSMHNPKLSTANVYYSDGIQHLTEAGYLAISPMIESWMRNMYTPGMAGGVSSWNDLADKPCQIVELMPQTQFSYDASIAMFLAQSDFEFVHGRTYVINWNGTAYTAEAKTTIYDGNVMVYVGNEAVAGGSDNGLPFVMGRKLYMLGTKGYLLAAALDGSTAVSVSVSGAVPAAPYDTADTLVLDLRIDRETNEPCAIYATKEEIFGAFVAGRRITASVPVNGDSGTISWFYQLAIERIDGIADTIHLRASQGDIAYTMHYNGDGMYTVAEE